MKLVSRPVFINIFSSAHLDAQIVHLIVEGRVSGFAANEAGGSSPTMVFQQSYLLVKTFGGRNINNFHFELLVIRNFLTFTLFTFVRRTSLEWLPNSAILFATEGFLAVIIFVERIQGTWVVFEMQRGVGGLSLVWELSLAKIWELPDLILTSCWSLIFEGWVFFRNDGVIVLVHI